MEEEGRQECRLSMVLRTLSMGPYHLIGEDEEAEVTEAAMDVVGMADADVDVVEADAVGAAEVETCEPINKYR